MNNQLKDIEQRFDEEFGAYHFIYNGLIESNNERVQQTQEAIKSFIRKEITSLLEGLKEKTRKCDEAGDSSCRASYCVYGSYNRAVLKRNAKIDKLIEG